jgi:hypothetical protein
VFKFFGEEDPEEFVPDVQKHELMLEMMRRMSQDMVAQMKNPNTGGMPMAGQPVEPEGLFDDQMVEGGDNEEGITISG